MGEWEGLTTDEIAERWPDVMEQIYRDGLDLPRGSTGETWAQLTARFAAAMAALEHDADGLSHAGIVSGGAVRCGIVGSLRNPRSHPKGIPCRKDVRAVAVVTAEATAQAQGAATKAAPRTRGRRSRSKGFPPTRRST